jgi:DNA-directed RNA polymerase specialized sigma24 family protein
MAPNNRSAHASDWMRTAHSPELRASFAVWREREPALAGFKDSRAVVAFMRGPAAREEKDAVLRALLSWSREEPVGGQVVLEVIRPGLLNLLVRLSRGSSDRQELEATLMAAAWEGTRRYPLERRPRRVAANLLLDAMHQTLLEVGHQAAWRAVRSALPTESQAAGLPVDADVDAVLSRAVSAGAVDAEEAELILLTRVDGVALQVLAGHRGVSYNTLKVRRQRAERRLLVFLGFRPVPRGRQNRPSSFARVAGAGSTGPDG